MATVNETSTDFDTGEEGTVVYKLLDPDSDEVQGLPPADPQNPTKLERLFYFTEHKVVRDDGRDGGYRRSPWIHAGAVNRNLKDDFDAGKAALGL